MKIIDTHCDTLLNCFRDSSWNLESNSGHISLEKMRQGNALAQFFAIYISRNELQTMDAYDIFKGVYDTYKRELSKNTNIILPAYCVEDVMTNMKIGKMSSILAIEDGVVIADKIDRVDEIFEKGVRLLTLTWNFENSIGFPCSDDKSTHMLGLKPFGVEVVEKMNELGMLVDVSHLSEGGFYDVVRYSKKPFVASHSCARSLCNHRRNLTDNQLKTLGQRGGMVGVNFCSEFLRENSKFATVDDIVDHVVYMANKAGIESVGLGSDFDGIDNEVEIKDYSGYPILIDALSKYFVGSDIDKICSKNILRVMSESLIK